MWPSPPPCSVLPPTRYNPMQRVVEVSPGQAYQGRPLEAKYIRTKFTKEDDQYRHVQSASIWSPVTLAEPASPPSQDFQSDGPRLTSAGAAGTSCCCVSSLRSVRETSGMWYPRRMLKSVSRRKHLAGGDGTTTVVDFIERTGLVAALVDEGVGEVARALGAGETFAGSCKGTSVRKSPVESTNGGLSSEPSGSINTEDSLDRAYMDEAVGSGNVCGCSSIGREYTKPSCLSVNTTSA
jgi:hypothetical protein